jgi:protein phosphatase
LQLDSIGEVSRLLSALLLTTPFRLVDLNDPASCEAATQWWVEMTAVGKESMVVKSLDFICKGEASPGATCGQVPWAEVSAHHL